MASPMATPGAVRPGPVMGEIVWAATTDPVTNAPLEIVTSYPADAPRMTASVLVTALPAGATIRATWEYNDTSLDAFSRQVVLSAPADRLWISFHIERGADAVWPAGVYAVTISLDGAEGQQASIDVAPS